MLLGDDIISQQLIPEELLWLNVKTNTKNQKTLYPGDSLTIQYKYFADIYDQLFPFGQQIYAMVIYKNKIIKIKNKRFLVGKIRSNIVKFVMND